MWKKNKSLKSLFQNQKTQLLSLVLNYIKLILPIQDNHRMFFAFVLSF